MSFQDDTVLEMLELAHGYALLGSIFPMRKAAAECGVSRESDIWDAANAALDAQLKLRLGERPEKPSMQDYEAALSAAIDVIEQKILNARAAKAGGK